MWITYPHFVWISDIHRFFRIGMWITFECIFCKPWTFAHLGGVIHIFCQFIHHRLLTTGEKSSERYPQGVDNVDNLSTFCVDKSYIQIC